MRYVIHLKPIVSEAAFTAHLIEDCKILSFIKRKLPKVRLFSEKRMIEFESDNPGIIRHIKSNFASQIECVLSDKHGAGKYKRPSHRSTPLGLLGPDAAPLTPIQVAKAYNFPQGQNLKERVVAIIELGGAYDPKNVYAYCKSLGIPSPQLYNHNVDGSTQVSDPNGADGEVSLDINVVAAVVPGLKILIIWAPNTSNGFIDGVASVATYPLKADALSISWGMPENEWDAGARAAMDNAIASCNQRGIPVFVASGDNGSSDGAVGNNVDYPASSPNAIGCGGTELFLNSDGSRNSEVVWNEQLTGEGAGGGGQSTSYPPLKWQPTSLKGRGVPDISGNADPNSGYIVDVDGQQQVIGGTSAVAPLMAGLAALLVSNLKAPLMNYQNLLYVNRQVFFDVVKGNNGAYSATAGYDCASGLGVPDGTKLLAALTPKVSLKARVVAFMKTSISDLVK